MTKTEETALRAEIENLKLQVKVALNDNSPNEALMKDLDRWRKNTNDFMEKVAKPNHLRIMRQRKELRRLNRQIAAQKVILDITNQTLKTFRAFDA